MSEHHELLSRAAREGAVREIDDLKAQLSTLLIEQARLREENERLTVQLAGCSTAAFGNTRERLAEAAKPLDAVTREVTHRENLEVVAEERDALSSSLAQIAGEMKNRAVQRRGIFDPSDRDSAMLDDWAARLRSLLLQEMPAAKEKGLD
jgi:regulator of replication initiation timing